MKAEILYMALLQGWSELTHSPSERGAVGFLLVFRARMRNMLRQQRKSFILRRTGWLRYPHL
jgi:hypothetical protein